MFRAGIDRCISGPLKLEIIKSEKDAACTQDGKARHEVILKMFLQMQSN